MCRNLSERAAEDLIAFVRRARREDRDLATPPMRSAALADLAESARALLAKHGLLTPADDPALAAVFMEPEPAYCPCGDGLRPGHPMGWCGKPDSDANHLRQYAGYPELTRAFMEDAEVNERLAEVHSDNRALLGEYEDAADPAHAALYAHGTVKPAGSPARMSYADTGKCGQCGDLFTECECRF